MEASPPSAPFIIVAHGQAIEADRKEDREIICGEVFTDLTGTLDDLAKGTGAVLSSQWRPFACMTMYLSI